ncbi:hypothetical protein LVD15_20690 [Fulvivirga maritima]|uniref:MbnP family protein n=1 Tax=Fulvivirga maritima TaxID=2904247 RepID=UPI001F344F7E|nr:MbnP family protein [Fulvivirga maritima]UII25700.1 hypothetical protein LVD15_20690 [Fulvivirga maritima]
MKNTLFFAALLCAFISLFSCSDDDREIIEEVVISCGSDLTLIFDNVLGEEDFVLNQAYEVGDVVYSFNSLRYWISNVSFRKSDGTIVEIPDSYYLIEDTEDVSIQDGIYTYTGQKREDINFADFEAGTYTSVIFSVGVDEEHNDNLSLSAGELSSMVGMTNVSWMWHTSYIFTSLKGTAESGDTKTVEIETGLNDNYRTIELELPGSIEVTNDSSYQITITADVLTTLQAFDNWENPVVGASQPELMESVSDNFAADFFTLKVPSQN